MIFASEDDCTEIITMLQTAQRVANASGDKVVLFWNKVTERFDVEREDRCTQLPIETVHPTTRAMNDISKKQSTRY